MHKRSATLCKYSIFPYYISINKWKHSIFPMKLLSIFREATEIFKEENFRFILPAFILFLDFFLCFILPGFHCHINSLIYCLILISTHNMYLFHECDLFLPCNCILFLFRSETVSIAYDKNVFVCALLLLILFQNFLSLNEAKH